MKASKTYLSAALFIVAAISFIVMVCGFFIRTTATGYYAVWVFGLSFFPAVFLNVPSDMGKRDVD